MSQQAQENIFEAIRMANMKGHRMGKIFSRCTKFVFCQKCNANLFWTPGYGYGGTAEFDCDE